MERRSAYIQSRGHTKRHSADDPIALGEHAADRGHGGSRFAYEATLLRDLVGQLDVFWRVGREHAAGQHGNRSPARCERGPMHCAVDAAGHAAHHGDTRAGEAGGQRGRLL